MRTFLVSTLLIAALVATPGALAADATAEALPCEGSALQRVQCIADKAIIFAGDVSNEVVGLICYEVPELCS